MATRIKEVTFTHAHNLANILNDNNLISVSLSSDGKPILLSLKHQPDYRIIASSGASFAKNKSAKENNFYVHWFESNVWSKIDLDPTFENFHFIQPAQDKNWIAVRSRSSGTDDHNAYIYSHSGQVISSFYAGDGIQDVQTGNDGSIWVSFFDEGVYSDQPYGHSGLIAFNQKGQVEFKYQNLQGWPGTIPPIDDCYALNVIDSNNVWCYYYSSFSLVHLVSGEIQHILPEVKIHGSHAFAISGESVYFAGSYKERDFLYRLGLRNEEVEKLRPLSENGKAIQKFRAIARGNIMYLVEEKQMFGAEF